jgi:DNA-binding response OmpR family regulator
MKTLLIIEDNQKIAQAMAIRLTHAGFNVVHAQDAVYAMAKALQYRPDLVILDINLPGGDGFLVAERLRAQAETASVPIVFITASKVPGLAQRVADVGAITLIEKPFSAAHLMDVIADVLSSLDQAA